MRIIKIQITNTTDKVKVTIVVLANLLRYTAKNTVISPDFLVWKLSLSTKFPHQGIRRNYSIPRSDSLYDDEMIYKQKGLVFPLNFELLEYQCPVSSIKLLWALVRKLQVCALLIS